MDRQYAQALFEESYTSSGDIAGALSNLSSCILDGAEAGSNGIDVFPTSRVHRDAASGGRLCRCRGMVQEVHPEPSVFPVLANDIFGGSLDNHDELLDAVFLYVIPVPGSSHLYQIGAESAAGAVGPTEGDVPIGARKRVERCQSNVDVQADDNEERQRSRKEGGCEIHNEEKKLAALKGNYLNIPYPPAAGELHTACIVILPTIDSAELRRGIKINDVIDFYGYLEPHDLAIQSFEDAEEDILSFGTWRALSLNPAIVPRLLCLGYEPLGARLCRSLSPLSFESCRQQAILYLTDTVCCGDELAAEYLLLHLCARVTGHSTVTPVGDLPLLVRSSSLNARQWSAELSKIAPMSEIFLDTALLANTPSLIPRHDTKEHFLRTGALQVANGTHFTVDCEGIAEALDSTVGGARDEELFSAVHKQTLIVDYTYQNVELPVDVSFLALSSSELDKAVYSTFNFAIQVRWCPEVKPDNAPVAATLTSSEDVRRYIDCVHHVTPSFSNAADIETRISNALCSLSDECGKWNNHDSLVHNNTFSATIALMRACAATYGRSTISLDDVEHVVQLERKRTSRL